MGLYGIIENLLDDERYDEAVLYIELSQKNIRIFDICYFLTGLPAEETCEPLIQKEWIEIVKSVILGYESTSKLSESEKNAIPCVMECIEILFVAYFTGIEDAKHAHFPLLASLNKRIDLLSCLNTISTISAIILVTQITEIQGGRT